MKPKLKKYPYWVCRSCGMLASGRTFLISTYHEGICEVCGKEKDVTQPRDFFYPKFDGFEKP